MAITWSKYSEDIFDWVKTGRGDLMINAVAGSGKTTNIVEIAANRTSGTTLMCAFNKHIADELAPKIGEHADVKTLHSIGYGAIASALRPTRIRMDEHKYRNLCEDRFATRAQGNTCARVFDLARATLTDCNDLEALRDLVEYHMLEDVTESMLKEMPRLVEEGKELARNGIIDYTDMIWIPAVGNLTPKRYQWVMVDECQDLNAAQLDLVLKTRASGGRMIFVGDPRQAIYGFAGADAGAFYAIQRRLQATELPLSVCYRCPVSVVEMAQQIVPQIESAPNAPAGIVRTIKEEQLTNEVHEGDLVLCRLTAPLIRECIKMIKNRIPARVRGRDLAKSLTGMVVKVDKRYGEFNIENLHAWSQNEVERMLTTKKHPESAIATHQDKVEGLMACYEAFGCDSKDKFCQEIDDLFSDGRAGVVLSTIHRAKGLEEKRVFALKPSACPLRYKSQNEWQSVQEMNLKYVMITRAKEEFIWLEEPPKGAK